MISLILCLQSNKNLVVAGGLKKPDPKMHAANFQAWIQTAWNNAVVIAYSAIWWDSKILQQVQIFDISFRADPLHFHVLDVKIGETI